MIRDMKPTLKNSVKVATIAGLAVAMGSCIEATGPSARLSEPRIAFVSNRDGNDEIYTMNSDGTNVVRITNNPARDTRPIWSPDGNSIAFVSERSGNRDIWIMNPDGSGLRNLTLNPAVEDAPSWSTDGNRVVFSSTRFGPAKIFITNASAGDTTVVLTDGFATDTWPTFSPDGRFIAFQADRNSATTDIYVLRNQFNDIFRLTFTVGADQDPAWSPDGTKIIFTTIRDGNFEIYAMDWSEEIGGGFAGVNQRNLTSDPGGDARASWSFNAQKICWTSNRGGNNDIWVMNADGSSPTRLTNNAAADDFCSIK